MINALGRYSERPESAKSRHQGCRTPKVRDATTRGYRSSIVSNQFVGYDAACPGSPPGLTQEDLQQPWTL
jgi:hypothetical protein